MAQDIHVQIIHNAIPHYYFGLKHHLPEKETKSPFVCFHCGEKRMPSEYGGEILGKSICEYCVPFADTQTVSYQINFDERHR